MADKSTHPSPEKLTAYGLGQLPVDQATLIEQHITECEPCCETMFDLASGDTFVELLCQANQAPAEQTVDHDWESNETASIEVPPQLAEHPRYEIDRLIGKGGMGEVYQARHRKMDRTVALKVINRKLVRNDEAVDRFHREVKTAAQLSHPNVVTAHDADNAGDYHFMVMEYVDGVDLSCIVKAQGALPVADSCNYIRQAAIGLQHAHEQGMVHRDIKPHNLMLTADGTVKILDFGLAAFAPEALSDVEAVEARSDLTAVGAIMGTPDFISPEQANDARGADIRSDIYSLGATLYYLLAGRPPFAEGSVVDKLRSHAHSDADRLDTLREDIPTELASVVVKMMAKDPDQRFQTPAEVEAALEFYLQGRKPKPVSPRLQNKPVRKRNRFLLLTGIATLFFAAFAAGVVFYLQTGNGTIRVALMDDSLEASIDGQKIGVKDGDKEFEISAGRQQLVIRRKGSDIEIATDKFRVWRDDEVRFEVELISGNVVVTKDGKPFGEEKLEPVLPSIADDATQESTSPSMEGFLVAKEAYVRAKRLEQSGDFPAAADAYLEAYRGDPTLLAYEQFATIKTANRTRDFVEVFNADRLLLVPLTGHHVERIVKEMIEDQSTRLDGRRLLDHMWEARPEDQWPVLANPPEDSVFPIRDPLFQIREKPFVVEKLPPTDPDWTRFRANNLYEAIGRNGGLLQRLTPELKDTVEQKIHLAKTVREVERTIESDPYWKAGLAVLAFLEAELENESRAIELLEMVLADTEHPITCGAAMTFGQALEGKTDALDQLVIRLFEKSVSDWGDFDLGEPEKSLNVSPIQNLAGLYAKYGRREEARRLLLRLTVPEGIGVGGSDRKYVTCSTGRVLFDYSDSGPDSLFPKVRTEDQVPDVNCMACHRNERNLWSYLSMADKLTDLGYPVDARLSLARIDASFGNYFGSDREWASATTPEMNGNSYFPPVSEKVDNAITPQAVLEALRSGAYNDIDLANPVIAKKGTNIDLMLSVRGEYGKSTLFSPVIDLLELAAKANGDEEAVAVLQIDQLLSEEYAKNPENVEAGICATVFAFLRGDEESAEERLKDLHDLVAANDPDPSDIELWLVGRLALREENTKAIGEALCSRALVAADQSDERLFKEALLREKKSISAIIELQDPSSGSNATPQDKKNLLDTLGTAGIFETFVAAIEAAGLLDTLAESGPYTILAPTDEAFAKLSKQTLEELLEPENREKLARILKYHVIPGRMSAEEVWRVDSLTSINEEPIYISSPQGRRRVNQANVIADDLNALNGFIHVIDEVLIPRSRTLVCVWEDVVEYDLEGNRVWETELELPKQAWGLATGERVVEHCPVDTGIAKEDYGTLLELIVYAAGDGPPRKLWSLPSSLLGARPLPSGEILVWSEEFVQRYDLSGRKLWETEVVWDGQKRVPLRVEPLQNGNLKVLFRSSTEGYRTRPDTAVEIDEQGQIVRELPSRPERTLLERLPNGNSLVLIEEGRKKSLLEERDATDKLVWSYSNDSGIVTAQRLPNGDTLIGAVGQLKTVDTNGTVTWRLDESQVKWATVGYDSFRYYPVLAP